MKEIYYLPVKFNNEEMEKFKMWENKENIINKRMFGIELSLTILTILGVAALTISFILLLLNNDHSGFFYYSGILEHNINNTLLISELICIIILTIMFGVIKFIKRLINPYLVIQKNIEIYLDSTNKTLTTNLYENKKLLDSETTDIYKAQNKLDTQNNIITINNKKYTIGENPHFKIPHSLKSIITDISSIEHAINSLIASFEEKEKEEQWLQQNKK